MPSTNSSKKTTEMITTTLDYQNQLIHLDKTDPEYSQRRMKLMVKYLQRYMDTYDEQCGYENYSDLTLILDILYGLGVVLDPEEHQFASGFDKWKEKLLKFLEDSLSKNVSRGN